jgi:carboxymethylenebutenolidase
VSIHDSQIPGDGLAIPAVLARPASPEARGVLVIHDVNGPNQFYRNFALRLAEAGFGAVLPDFFVREGPLENHTREAVMERATRLDQRQVLRDIASSLRWTQTEFGGPTAVIGFCMGGTLAMLAAARDPLPAVCVAFYGFPYGRQGWPYRPIDEVAQLRAPVLAFWGDQDLPVGLDSVEAYVQAVTPAGASVETVIYAGLPHGFLTFDPEATAFPDSQDAWSRTIAFLKNNVAS